MHDWSGMYSSSIVAKSGSPVFGQTDVNSGQEWWMMKSRWGAGLGKVSRIAWLMGRVYFLSWFGFGNEKPPVGSEVKRGAESMN